jgi:glutamine---fructose-6-phosphate transaminase (isomerizing)
MALEAGEAPEVVARTLSANVAALDELARLFRSRRPSHIITCARGSSDHAASYFKYLVEIFLGIPVCSLGPSVVSVYGAQLKLRDALLVTISQSGRSPDILAVQAEVRRAGIPAIAITNDISPPVAAGADFCLPMYAGPELSIAATKTFIASMVLAAALIAAWADDRRLREALRLLPEDLARARDVRFTSIEEPLANATSLYVVGRGPSLSIAQEAATKLKETSRLHAEAFSAAEILHGPIELVQSGFNVLMFAPRDVASATTAATSDRLREAGAAVLLPDYHATRHPALDPISMIQSFYASAERIARVRGFNPDRARLLVKSTLTV